jgi:hypothetical protein
MTVCYAPPDVVRFILAPDRLDPVCRGILSRPQTTTQVSALYYLGVFLLTCVLEAPFYLWALKGSAWDAKSRWLAVVWLNLATHPAVYFVFPWLSARRGGCYAQTVAAGEVFAWLVEAALLGAVCKLSKARSAAFSLAANLCSWWIGLYVVRALR